MLGRIIWTIFLMGSGLGLIVYTKRVKDFTGSFDFAEKWFGIGGTYTFLKILGLVVIIGTFLWITGTLGRLVPDVLLGTSVPSE